MTTTILAEVGNHRALQLEDGIVLMERRHDGQWKTIAYCSIDNAVLWRGFVERGGS